LKLIDDAQVTEAEAEVIVKRALQSAFKAKLHVHKFEDHLDKQIKIAGRFGKGHL
jgi:imidazolonepropionase-like amidohydrolase